MSDRTRFHMRRSLEDADLMANLAKRYGQDEAGLVRFAIRYLDEHGPMQGKGETVDDYDRISELAQELVNTTEIRRTDFRTTREYAERLVDWWVGVGTPTRGEPLPTWWEPRYWTALMQHVMGESKAREENIDGA